MTTRDDARRRSEARSGPTGRCRSPNRWPASAERLLAARERKGVDLYRAERDTKIRARYLGALERGEYRELPGSVYTKGFLRNYALYLGLDPDEILVQWRREKGEGKVDTSPSIVAAPAARRAAPGPDVLAGDRRGRAHDGRPARCSSATSAIQLLRFAKPPSIAVVGPVDRASAIDAETDTAYTFRGTTIPHGTVTIAIAGGTAPGDGRQDGAWSQVGPAPARPQRVQDLGHGPGHRQELRADAWSYINVPSRRDPGADAHGRSAGRRGELRERRDPRPGQDHERHTGRRRRDLPGPVDGRRRPAAAAGSRAAGAGRPGAGAGHRHGREDGTFSDAVRAGQRAAGRSRSPRPRRGGQDVTLTRNVTVAYKGVNLVVDDPGRPAPGSRSGSTASSIPTIGAAGQVFGDGKVLTFTGDQTRSRSGPARRARRTSR